MKYKIVILSLFTLFGLVNQSVAQENQSKSQEKFTLSLNQAFDLALKNSYELKKTKIDLKIAEKKIWETTAIGLPQVDATVDITNMLKIPTQLIPGDIIGQPGTLTPVKFGSKYGFGGSATISQLLFSGEYLVGLQAANVYKQLSEEAITKTELDAKQLVTQSYCVILVAKANRQMLQETKDNMNSLLKETEAFYQNGLVEETAVDQIKILIINIENGISAMDRQIEIGDLLLKYQLGIGMGATLELTDNLNSISNKFTLEPIASSTINFDNLIDYKLMKTNEDLLELSLKREKSKYLPTVAGFWQYSYKAQGNRFGNFMDGTANQWFPSSILGASVNIPIFNSGTRISRVNQAKLELDKMQVSLQQVQDGILLQVEQARTAYNTALDKYYREKENVGLSKKIYDRTLIKVKEGIGTSTDLTQNYNQYLTNQTNFYLAIFDVLNAKNSLNRVLNRY